MNDPRPTDPDPLTPTDPTDGGPGPDPVGHANGLTRREALKLSGLALGGLALGATVGGLIPQDAQA